MVVLYHAYTAPVNPAGAEPVLTRERVWAGLQRKVRQPTEFVPVMKSSEIVSEEGDVVTRLIEFKPQWGPSSGKKTTEVCTSFGSTKIVYEMDTGDKVTNLISDGPSGNPEDIFLTYVFELDRPEADEQRTENIAKDSVDSSLATLRRLAKEGKI